MKKAELLEKLEKFDLTELQLSMIEDMISLEIIEEQEDFTPVLEDIAEKITNVEYPVLDISDVGNEIGIAVGKYIKTEQHKREFVNCKESNY